ncbi:MAG: hypothetical protein ACI920_002930, partial [Saprospiraceae bacterium]
KINIHQIKIGNMILFCIFYLSQSKLYFVLTYVLVENFQTTSK